MGEGRISKLGFLTHHEAGHAAVAVYFGLRLDQVRVEQDDNSGGISLTEEALRKLTDIQRVLIALAGSIAERHLDPSGDGPWKGPDGDEAWALRTVVARLHSRLERRSQDYIDRLLERMKNRLADRCALIVNERWLPIQRLAAELAHRASVTPWVELTGEEAESLLAGEDQ